MSRQSSSSYRCKGNYTILVLIIWNVVRVGKDKNGGGGIAQKTVNEKKNMQIDRAE